MLLDGSEDADRRLKSMLLGCKQRNFQKEVGLETKVQFSIKRAMEVEPNLKVTLPILWMKFVFLGLNSKSRNFSSKFNSRKFRRFKDFKSFDAKIL